MKNFKNTKDLNPISGTVPFNPAYSDPYIKVEMFPGRQMRRAFRNIRRTLPEIFSVLVLFLLIIAVFALMACKIFGHRGWEKVS